MPDSLGIPDSERIRIESQMRSIARSLDEAFKKGGMAKHFGFALFLFGFDNPFFTWVSNANRADMIKAMREWLDRVEAGQGGSVVGDKGVPFGRGKT